MQKLILALALLWPMAASAEYFDGNELQEYCVDTKEGEPRADPALYNTCVGYLSGLADAAVAFSSWGFRNVDGQFPPGGCIPELVSLEQMRQAWLQSAGEYADKLNLIASHQVLKVLEQEWPCGIKQP